MAQITAADVNKLRQQTGAGMMDCKKALVEAEGDFEAAIDLLRKKGQKVAAKRGDNEASEGQIVAITNADNTKGIIVALNCETDFVAKNQEFSNFINGIANFALNSNITDLEALKKADYQGGLTLEEKITEQVGKVGEKLDLSAFSVLEGANVVAYNHPGNGIASLVLVSEKGEKATEVASQVAMQAAAMAPIALDKDDVDAATVAKELEIGKGQAIEEGKTEEMAEKIAQGRLGKFFKEATLLNQEYIFGNKESVAQYVDSNVKGLKVLGFKRHALK
ncbi:MAG: translation elongation factor Ts [Luteibaculaceae bacterium]